MLVEGDQLGSLFVILFSGIIQSFRLTTRSVVVQFLLGVCPDDCECTGMRMRQEVGFFRFFCFPLAAISDEVPFQLEGAP